MDVPLDVSRCYLTLFELGRMLVHHRPGSRSSAGWCVSWAGGRPMSCGQGRA